MKRVFTILPALFAATIVTAQDKQTGSPVNELQLESQAERQEGVTEDDTQWQQLEYFQKHPLNLNNADADDLKQLHLLTDLQITNFLRYKKMLGPLLSVYELQAVPAWDVLTIKQLLPFITVSSETTIIENMGKRLWGGEHSVLFRYGEAVNRSAEYKKTMSSYAGSAAGMLFRYKYNYKNLLQYGVTGDKDAGEAFFKGAQRTGFDFYSFHFFARKLGVIQSLAIGDFTVHFGQGLIQWQGLAFKKSADVLNVKRQAPALQPYNSAGEYNFHRGVGITLRKKNIECTLFGSIRKLTANIIADSLLPYENAYISSINTSGYHRSLLEIGDRNNVQLQTAGGSLKIMNSKGQIGINAVEYAWSKPMKPSGEPYDLYAMDGNRFGNYSFDYSYTLRNMHVFGEVAADHQFNRAMIHGLLASLDPTVDMAILYRNISSRYQSMFSNAFTENSLPFNENGWYAGISIRPRHGVKLDAYADIFRFPWLKFQANAPSGGYEYLVQVTVNPNKNAEIYSRFRSETKSANMSDSPSAVQSLPDVSKLSWRTQISYRVSRATLLRSRVEAVWYANNIPQLKETGFLFFTDVHVKPAFKPFSFNGRIQYVETDGYNARIYAWENTVQYSYYIPAFFDKALRYVISVNYRLTNLLLKQPINKFNCLLSLSFSQSVYPSKSTVGLSNSTFDDMKRSDIRLQIILATR